MLRLLLDVHIPLAVANQIARKKPRLEVHHISRWKGGEHVQDADDIILEHAAEAGLTFVTFDLRTIPEVISEWSEAGIDHAGIILVDDKAIGQSDVGALVRGFIQTWDELGRLNWKNRVVFLVRPE